MRPTFQPFLVNDPFHDPGLYINLVFENRAVVFDLGDIHALSPKSMLKISHCFISHTHMDHFAGFDRLLRLLLGRNKTVHLFGPENFLNNLEGKLAGYTWNLTQNYAESLTIHATEVRQQEMRTRIYRCRDRFSNDAPVTRQPYTGLLLSEPGFTVSSIILDHDIPCLGFRLNERFHINIKKSALTELGLAPGPWLNEFKQTLFSGYDEHAETIIPDENNPRIFRTGSLADKIALITPGQTITYITDVVWNESNAAKIIDFARDSDHLFIEAYFLDQDMETARLKFHLTARQAGTIAGLANVGRLTTFHYSPRYADNADKLEQEAQKAFTKHDLLR